MRYTLRIQAVFLAIYLLVSGCSEDKPSGPIQVRLIKNNPAGGACAFHIAPTEVQTLTSLRHMQGAVGRVAVNSSNLGSRPEILDSRDGFSAPSVRFARSGSIFSPLDMDSLFAVSLYYAVEATDLLYRRIGNNEQVERIASRFGASTTIVHEARRTFGEVGVDPEIADNAEYLSHSDPSGVTLDYIFSFPTDTVSDMPLGLNVGIVAHETAHRWNQHFFYEPGIAADVRVDSSRPTMNTLAALDEGVADLAGFMVTQDPSFFHCSFPGAGRDLSRPKTFTSEVVSRLSDEGSFDPHEGGAVWAAINYQIGLRIGHERNFKLVIGLFPHLLNCSHAKGSGQSNTISLDFRAVAACHAELATGTEQAAVREIYNQYLGSYGGI